MPATRRIVSPCPQGPRRRVYVVSIRTIPPMSRPGRPVAWCSRQGSRRAAREVLPRRSAAQRLALDIERIAQAGAPHRAGVEALLQPVEEAQLRPIRAGKAGAVVPAMAALLAPVGLPVPDAQILA